MSRDHLRNKLGRHFSIFLAMSDTQEFLFLDSALLKQAVDMKKMKNLKKKVEWKVIEIMERGAWRRRLGAECRTDVQDWGADIASPSPTLTTLVPQEENQKQKLMEKSKDPEQPDVKD